MKKEFRDGLLIDNSILVEDVNDAGFAFVARLFQLLAILVGAWSFVSIFLESIPVPANVAGLHLTILLSFILAVILCLIPSYNGVKLFFCIFFYALFFISRFKAIQNGFYIMENEVVTRLEEYFDTYIGKYVADYSTQYRDSNLLMIMIVIPVVFLLAIAVFTGMFVKIASAVLLLPVAASFLFGLTPSEHYMVSCVATVLYLTRLWGIKSRHLDSELRGKLHRINSWAGVWLSLICLLLFFIIKLFISEDSYSEITQIKDMRYNIQTTLNSITLEDITESISNYKLPEFNSAKGGLDGGALGRTGKVEFNGNEQLRITADYDAIKDGLYLKGYVGSIYTGDRWTGHGDEESIFYRDLIKEIPDEYHPMHQTIELAYNGWLSGHVNEFDSRQIKVEYVFANRRFLYAPYYTDFRKMKNINYKYDLYASSSRQLPSYTFKYYDLLDMTRLEKSSSWLAKTYFVILDKDYDVYERKYRDFVHRAYTIVPEEGLAELKSFCYLVRTRLNLISIDDKIDFIREYLHTNTSYSLTPGKVPQGQDYVEYFLFENKQGYCSHYASAAVLMLRLLGVPARYVEGYAVSAADIAINTVGEVSFLMDGDKLSGEVELSVKDYNAHAWVEVYYNGVGWVPVEFTPATGIGYNVYSRQSLTPSITASPTPVEASPTPTNAPTPAAEEEDENAEDTIEEKNEQKPSPSLAPKREEQQKPKVEAGGKSGMGDGGAQGDGVESIVLVQKEIPRAVIILLVILIALYLVTVLILIRNARLRRASYNKRAIYIFARVERVLNFISGGWGKRIQLEDNEEYLKKSFDFINVTELESFMYTVRKARYGKGRITGRELQQVKLFYNSFVNRILGDLPFIRRVLLKLILLVN